MFEKNKLFVFGFGYTAAFLASQLNLSMWQVAGTSRRQEIRDKYLSSNICLIDYMDYAQICLNLKSVTHLLISIPPVRQVGDVVIADFSDILKELAPHLKWIGYLSTTGVYGDHDGNWVDECSMLKPDNERAILRVGAEKNWLQLGEDISVPVQIFRLSAIYGPSRNVLRQLLEGEVSCIFKAGHYFSRIQVEDIVQVLLASMNAPQMGEIYNLADDEPTPSHEVIQYAATLLKVSPPKLLSIEKAKLSPMTQEFYNSHRKVSNAKIKQSLGIKLKYPSYREGLRALLQNCVG
ncbi:SDR family oxidoreductase [Candidatus Berkiella cookevillensis]|uniref:SDR family oxidoreductase n=1 Tax=Candidatus Berkiella cookevillensis TaxID=437022 RepID=A0A0Q9YKF3_9GAMM|nr:SDR family oxidoreductase [Candidatus Berkiella cookevillensis]MCS5709780.1 SDR family oxidoreductase [Candidatus Berkiella cookevillensis]